MIEKTKGIVLQQIRYGDNSRIVHIYTDLFGKLVFLVKGMGKRSKLQRSFFFPLSLLDLEISYKPARNMQNIRDASAPVPLINLHTEIRKTTVALFISEILSKTLSEEEANPQLFNFLYHSVLQLEHDNSSTGIFHLLFLARLTGYLGFQPVNSFSDDHIYFDLREGAFVPSLPTHADFLDKEDSQYFSFLFHSPDNGEKIFPGTPPDKMDFLEKIIRYYRIHLEGMGKINSLNILHEIFH